MDIMNEQLKSCHGKYVPTAARYEQSTQTIRSVPENYWLTSMDSWDGAVDHEKTARIFAASFEMKKILQDLLYSQKEYGYISPRSLDEARALIKRLDHA